MDFIIKKIFDGKGEKDDLIHLQFKKFSRGEFKNRAMIIAKNSNGKFSISTTSEYANEFVRCLAEKLGEEKTRVSGVIVLTRDLSNEIDFINKKQFMGVKQYVIDKEMSGDEILELCDKLPSAFMGLSFKARNSELNIKPKVPKSSKPSTKGENKPKIDFCKLKTSDFDIVKSLIFDSEASGFREVEINHDFIINEIIIPEELKNEKDFSAVREKAWRKGKVIRKLYINGLEIVKEKDFIA